MAGAIFINKPLGAIRDVFRARYFGVSLISDAFFMAWRIPNMLRRILTDGAFSSALVPTIIELQKQEGEDGVNKMMTALFYTMNIIVLLLCLLISYYAAQCLFIFSPGAEDRIALAIPLLRILIFFTIFMSASTILGAALQTKHNFVIGPRSQLVLNILLTLEYYICWYLQLSPVWCAMGLTLNGLVVLIIHYYGYKKAGFVFSMPNTKAFFDMGIFLKRVIPAIITSGVSEINIVADQALASYLAVGSQTLLDYTSTFIRIPIQVFGSAFSTVVAPVMAKIALENKNRISFYIFEASKMAFFLTLPSIIIIMFFASKLFSLLYVSHNFSYEHAQTCAYILQIFSGIIYTSIMNKFLVTIFYGFKHFNFTTITSLISSIFNIIASIMCMYFWGLYGIVAATVLAELLRYIIFVYALSYFNISKFFFRKFFLFCIRCIKHIMLTTAYIFSWFCALRGIIFTVDHFIFNNNYCFHIVFETLWYFVIMGVLLGLGVYIHWKNMKKFNIHLFFLKI